MRLQLPKKFERLIAITFVDLCRVVEFNAMPLYALQISAVIGTVNALDLDLRVGLFMIFLVLSCQEG